uniref:Uncharacterized protein n=1 Tax=Gopherus evgoodei TaxID=1825980 RepID=A0A8C4WT55_9SAUR
LKHCFYPQVHLSGSGWSPVYAEENLSVMSVGFLLSGPDDAVIWRRPPKMVCRMIKQFLCDVQWGEIDYLIVDTPSGTSDEHLSIVEVLLQIGFVCPKCKVRLSKNILTRLNIHTPNVYMFCVDHEGRERIYLSWHKFA